MKRDASEQNDLIGGPACICLYTLCLGQGRWEENCVKIVNPFQGFFFF